MPQQGYMLYLHQAVLYAYYIYMENNVTFTLLEQMCSFTNVLIIDVSDIWVLHIYLSDFDVCIVKLPI
jgi:hypothetical protein